MSRGRPADPTTPEAPRPIGAGLVALLMVLLLALADPKAALAQTAAIVVYIEGPEAQAVRSVVLEALPPGIKLADESAFHAELVREGQNRPIGKDLDPVVIDRVRRAARIMGVAAVVVVRVRRDQTARRALLLVVPAWKTPASAEEATLAFTSHDDDVAAVASVLGPSLEAYRPEASRAAESRPTGPPPPERDLREGQQGSPTSAPQVPAIVPSAPLPPVQSTAPAAATAAPTRTPAQIIAASVVDVAVAGGIVGRRFDYKNGIDPGSQRNTLFPAPMVGVRGQLFPLAHAGAPWQDIGVVAEYARIFSEMNDAGSVPADLFPSSYSAGVRARIHPGSDPRLILGLSVEYTFTSRRAVGPAPSELPDVTYRSVRPAIDARVSFGRFSLLEEVAYRALFDEGAISSRFYAPQGHGLDAELGAALMLGPSVEGRLAADYELHSFAFNPPAGAPFGPGSARDQLYGAQLAVAFVL